MPADSCQEIAIIILNNCYFAGMKKLAFIILSTLSISCGISRKIHKDVAEVRFLDEYVIPEGIEIEGKEIGGLSGIDYDGQQYYLVCDQASAPRFYKAEINLFENKIDTIKFTDQVLIEKGNEYKNTYLDLESIRKLPNSDLLISSEGLISESKDPGIFRISENGELKTSFELPDYFKASGSQKPRNNGVFEATTLTDDETATWVATELPLEEDGEEPRFYPTTSLVRFTKFDIASGKPRSQFVYRLDGIPKIPINVFAVNGITEILEYEKDQFLVLERAYSAGYGAKGNTVKIFQVNASTAENTLEMPVLNKKKVKPVQKNLIFNFNSVKNKLTDRIIDNIEGITFGPQLPNGKQSLILVSDNNFSSYSRQLNQIILLEIDIKK